MKIVKFASNMTVVRKDNGDEVLISYSTPVAARINGKFLKTSDYYSVTATRHINKWGAKDGEVVTPRELEDLAWSK